MPDKVGQLLVYLKEAVQVILRNPVTLYPLATIIFVHLLVLEILYFANRFPLIKFFGPIIERRWGETYLHYPFNFEVIPRLFQYFKIPLYIFVVNFLIAITIKILTEVNSHRRMTLRNAVKAVAPQYIDILVFSLFSAVIIYALYSFYSFVMLKTWVMKGEGVLLLFWKEVILGGQPYLNLLISVFVTAAFAYVLPIIVIDRQKILPALRLNFRKLLRSWMFILCVVLVPTPFYVPILVFKNSITSIANSTYPEIWFWVLIFSVLVTTFIDAVVYTVVTLDYLLERESS